MFESLREAFDGNGGKTTRIPKGENGADILHEVFHKGEACGRIIVDAKNRQLGENFRNEASARSSRSRSRTRDSGNVGIPSW